MFMSQGSIIRTTNYQKNSNRAIREGRDVEPRRMSTPFYETRSMFMDLLGYEEPLSYDEWLEVSSDYKAAVLYVQFFEQITLAWYKCRSFYAVEEDGVSTVLQYLNKNVPILEKEPKRFTPGYIYKVAYNCMYCICHDIQRDKLRWENECSNIVDTSVVPGMSEIEVNLFDTIVAENYEDDFIPQEERMRDLYRRDQFWALIEDMGKDAKYVVAKLLGESSYTKKELDSVDEAETARIIAMLQEKLADFKDLACLA